MISIIFLVHSLALIALPYEEQQQALPENIDILDEVVTNFQDAMLFMYRLMEVKRLSYQAVTKILHCHAMIEENLMNDDCITSTAFEHHQAWNMVRSVAKEALMEMEEFDWKNHIEHFHRKSTEKIS